MRFHTEKLPDAVVAHTRLPRSMVETTIRRMKEAGRIPKGFRHAPPLTAKDLARFVMGLSAMSPTAAVEREKAVGRIAEGALIELVEACAGIRPPKFDLASGEVVIGQTESTLEIHATHTDGTSASLSYGKLEPDLPCRTTFTITIPAIRAIARDLMDEDA